MSETNCHFTWDTTEIIIEIEEKAEKYDYDGLIIVDLVADDGEILHSIP